MPDQTSTAYTIVPWVRRGLASLINASPATNYATLPVTLRLNNTPVNGPDVRLIGPGQITALDSRAVVRTDPANGASAFEPNYLPMVELAVPDLPWMFTPLPAVNGRLQPWICLVVVPETDGIEVDSVLSGISLLRFSAPATPASELPDLSTIDAWAHAQVTGAQLAGTALNSALDGNPSATVSRLISARRLDPNSNYIACIVPTFRAGVNAALGLPVDDHDLAPAWVTDVSAPFVLPAYYVFRFQTAAQGDFASLAQKIHPPKTKLDAGTRTMDVGQPGFGMDGVPGVQLGLEGALKTVDGSSTPWPAGAQATYESQFTAALVPPVVGDPAVAPPTYGKTHSGSPLPAAGKTPTWLRELNLDPRSRASASAGSQVVQRDQEALVASAWDQLGEIRQANQLLRQSQLARQVSISMSRRHLERIAGDGKWLQITAPVHSRIRVALAGITATVYGHVEASRLPSGALSPAMRRMSRPSGPVGRQFKPGVPQIVERLNMPAGSSATALQVMGPLQPPRGMVGLDDIVSGIQVKNMTARSLESGGGWQLATEALSSAISSAPTKTTEPAAPARTETTVGSPVELATGGGAGTVDETHGDTRTNSGGPPRNLPLIDWQSNPNLPPILKGAKPNLPPPIVFPAKNSELDQVEANFRVAAQSINTYLNTAPAPPPDRASLGGQAALTPVRAQISAALNPGDTIRARIGARIALGAGADPLQPIEAGPKYPQPMYAPLAELSPEWMLPGISKIEADCATLLATNPAFIEAYMVGLNDEMSRELLWREFPADRRATCFQNFWTASPDIPAIENFNAGAHLGDNIVQPTKGSQFVLLIRATLFQRYPNAMVYACEAKWSDRVRVLTDNVQFPIFRGEFGQEVKFFAFDLDDPKGSSDPSVNKPGWYFVIAEHVTEPRVGLEPEKKATPTGEWNDLSWQEVKLKGKYLDVLFAPPTPSHETVAWSESSGALGYILIRRPVRVALHAQALLGDV
jgi:hypothetical protein